MESEARDPGNLLLTIIRLLDGLADEDLRNVVRVTVEGDEERRNYDQLARNVTRDTLLLLSARTLCNEVMQLQRRAALGRRPTA